MSAGIPTSVVTVAVTLMVPDGPSQINPGIRSTTQKMVFPAELLIRTGVDSLAACLLNLHVVPLSYRACPLSSLVPARARCHTPPPFHLPGSHPFCLCPVWRLTYPFTVGANTSLPDSAASSGYTSVVDILFDSATSIHPTPIVAATLLGG